MTPWLLPSTRSARGFGAHSTADEVLDGHRPDRQARRRHRRLLGARPRDDPRAHRRRRPRRRPRPPAGRRRRRRSAGIDGVEVDELDLGDLDSVARLRRAVPRRPGRELDIVIDNAGIMACPETAGRARAGRRSSPPTTSATSRWSTASGRRSRRGGARVVVRCPRAATTARRSAGTTCSSSSGYDKWQAYGQAKTANVLFAVAARRARPRTRACARSRCTRAAS